MSGGLKIAGRLGGVGHILIARRDKRDAAQARLERMGIDAITLPAVEPRAAIEGTYARFNGGTIPRTAAQQGVALSHIAAMTYARMQGWEWVGLWEEDVDGVAALGSRDLSLPADCGVVYLGGILWAAREAYGIADGVGVWRVTQNAPVSCTHAVMIHRDALPDVLASCAILDMTIDDCVSRACMDATRRGNWSTCFMQPWLAWQIDREETKPEEELS